MMHFSRAAHRQCSRVCIFAISICAMGMPAIALAEVGQTTFELRPHCNVFLGENVFGGPLPPSTHMTDPVPETCRSYAVQGPETRQTDVLSEGDPLDMDLIVHNPGHQPIERFRAWIAYDSTVLEGEKIEISTQFPTPNPGEMNFSVTDGYIKLSGAATKPQSGDIVVLAHIRMHVLHPSAASTPVSYYDASGKLDSHTGVFVKSGTQETNITSANLGSLIVQLNAAIISSSSLSSSSSTVPSPNPTPTTISSATSSALTSSKPSTSVFTLLQIQGLRVTTEGSSVFLAWDKLPSQELVGYNIYYGTISGKYIQRRSVDKNTTSITIRALPVATTYYFAVRGVNAANKETDFSQEVGISVGNAATSTSPLTAAVLKQKSPKTPRTGGSLSGETGAPSTISLFLMLSAVIGTTLAFRRQLSARHIQAS